MSDDTATITDNAQRHRFEISYDGTVAGFMDYTDRGKRRSLTHTEVDDAFEGRGVGSKLVRHVLDDARERGIEVLPDCPFVREYIDRHRDDYLDLVPQEERARFAL